MYLNFGLNFQANLKQETEDLRNKLFTNDFFLETKDLRNEPRFILIMYLNFGLNFQGNLKQETEDLRNKLFKNDFFLETKDLRNELRFFFNKCCSREVFKWIQSSKFFF